MARFGAVAAALALLAVTTGQALAGDDGYCARLGPRDHFNSSGVRLNTVGAVIQQDRANFHQFGQRDAEDESDPIFHDRVSRDALRRRIDETTLSPAERQEILNGSPFVCLAVEGDTAVILSIQ